jgi:hypothetical protein
MGTIALFGQFVGVAYALSELMTRYGATSLRHA